MKYYCKICGVGGRLAKNLKNGKSPIYKKSRRGNIKWYYLYKHHLIPKSTQNKGEISNTIRVCKPCHTTIHQTFSNNWLAKFYNTEKRLLKAMENI